jgi:hypothetical protein
MTVPKTGRVRIPFELAGWKYADAFAGADKTLWVDFNPGVSGSPVLWKVDIEPPHTDAMIEAAVADFLVDYVQSIWSARAPREVLLGLPPRQLRQPPWLKTIQNPALLASMSTDDVLFYTALADALYSFDRELDAHEKGLRRKVKSYELKDLFDEFVGGRSRKKAGSVNYIKILKSLKPVAWGRAVRELRKALPVRPFV